MRSSEGDFSLDYNLYRDSARTEIWGDGTGSTFIRGGVGTGVPAQFNLYGRIPGRQNVKADIYNDSVIVTVEW
jgi:spore coat protein U-like protein